jgi:hypothetical protein
MPKLLGIIGALVICAGLDLLWQSRQEIKFWLAAYINVFRSILRRREYPVQPVRGLPVAVSPAKRKHAVRFLLGVGFAFLLGPILIALSVTLLLYKNL